MRIDEPRLNPALEQDWPPTYATVDDYELDQDGMPVYVKPTAPRDPAPQFAETLEVLPADDGARLPRGPRLSRAQQRLDEILTNAEDELREARDLVVSALEDFGLVAQPQHPNLPTLIGQQLEQVIEHRNLRRR
jgi:hypothetical protein